jgi:hypothetical protein
MIWYWSAGGSSAYGVLSGVYACGSVGLCGVSVVLCMMALVRVVVWLWVLVIVDGGRILGKVSGE